MSLLDRVRGAFRDGEMFVEQYELARRLWPQDQYPRAWLYAVQGGPPGWVRTWGAAVKRYDIQQRWCKRRAVWLVYRPNAARKEPKP